MKGMSERQRDVYFFIDKYHKENGYSPSIADIACGLGISNSTVVAHIEIMKRKGFVSSIERVPRSIKTIPVESLSKH